MTPREYLEVICAPSVDEFKGDPISLRRAWTALVTLVHFADYLAGHRQQEIEVVLRELENDVPGFGIIRDAANAGKHRVADRRKPSPRKGLSRKRRHNRAAPSKENGND
jgi:hypothetical protein